MIANLLHWAWACPPAFDSLPLFHSTRPLGAGPSVLPFAGSALHVGLDATSLLHVQHSVVARLPRCYVPLVLEPKGLFSDRASPPTDAATAAAAGDSPPHGAAPGVRHAGLRDNLPVLHVHSEVWVVAVHQPVPPMPMDRYKRPLGKFVEGCMNMSTEEARRHTLNRDQIEVFKIKAFAYDQKRKHNESSNGFRKGALPLRLSTSDSTGWTLSISLPNGFKVRTAVKCGKSIVYKTTTDILSLGRGYKVAGVFVFNGYCDLDRDAESTFSISAKAIALTFIKSKSVQTEFNLDIDDLSDGDGSDSD